MPPRVSVRDVCECALKLIDTFSTQYVLPTSVSTPLLLASAAPIIPVKTNPLTETFKDPEVPDQQ